MSDKPVWLLDIDGVLNVVHRPAIAAFDSWREATLMTEVPWADGKRELSLCVAPEVVDFINKVHDNGLAEIRWHSTWQHTAAQFAELFGLPDLPVHPAPECRPTLESAIYSGPWWKEPGARRVIEQEKRRLLWTDDDLDYGLDRLERQYWHRLHGGNALLICPRSRVGLTRAQLDLIWTWLGGTPEPFVASMGRKG